jgi:acyl dehydratase
VRDGTDARSTRLYLEDLAVGDTFESTEHVLDAEQILEFARRFDPQPFHTDEEEARSSFFGVLAANGWHTAATTMRLLVEGACRFRAGSLGGQRGHLAAADSSGGCFARHQHCRGDPVIKVTPKSRCRNCP